ncbi:DNA repair ATPase-related [Abeliophyllum distichum]|uniref:DNA repair ATPase-related n=1 Tax=Abeliophyllum distichum TaxID=126358 RepID=A0ABD1R432_9LAMI
MQQMGWDPGLGCGCRGLVCIREEGSGEGRSEEGDVEFLHNFLGVEETRVDEKLRELRSKDESSKQLEKIAEEKSNSLASLQSEVQLLQEKGSLDAKELVGKVDEQASKLEKQIVNLKKEIEVQNRKTDELETRANVAEKKIEGMNLKLESLRLINDEQRSKIRKAERALQVAQEEMVKDKLKASSISQQLNEVHQAWLLPWFSAHFGYCKTIVVANWKEHAKPALDLTIEQALEKLSEVEKWAQPHFETFKTEWIPAIKECCMAFVSNIEQQLQSLTTKAFDFYQVTKGIFVPHIVKIQEIVDPYFQEAKRFTKPHIDHVSRIAKPHADKARVFLKPYSNEVLRNYKKIAENVRIYHSQVQANLYETLNSYEFTKPLATEELLWLMASILMALPVVFLFRILLRKKPRKRTHKTRTSHTRRRLKLLLTYEVPRLGISPPMDSWYLEEGVMGIWSAQLYNFFW